MWSSYQIFTVVCTSQRFPLEAGQIQDQAEARAQLGQGWTLCHLVACSGGEAPVSLPFSPFSFCLYQEDDRQGCNFLAAAWWQVSFPLLLLLPSAVGEDHIACNTIPSVACRVQSKYSPIEFILEAKHDYSNQESRAKIPGCLVGQQDRLFFFLPSNLWKIFLILFALDFGMEKWNHILGRSQNETSLSYMVNSRMAWDMEWDLVIFVIMWCWGLNPEAHRC